MDETRYELREGVGGRPHVFVLDVCLLPPRVSQMNGGFCFISEICNHYLI